MGSSGAPTGATWLLTRVLVVPLVVIFVAGAFVVTARALAVREAGVAITETARPFAHQPWKDAYARRFPGCVPVVLWPGRETPSAVIVRWEDRTVERVERGQALRRALVVQDVDSARIIGACYR